ncbi:MAG: 1-acyl-sn-glycerol-3-phosphate acyltransferase [Bacteroidia bacterium]|nr:1-acyl-sn-glycerol-3-phosphate acyltransferase [Bacteroidia bacterium]
MRRIKFIFLRTYMRIGLFFYMKSIRFHGIQHIPTDKPTLILCNHQNALIEALILAVNLPKYGYFLTRASVFKIAWISRFLKGIKMLPVYRIRDGWHNLENNKSIFHECVDILSKNEILVLFPEGSHNLVRRVRPLSKGFTRIVFEFFETHPNREIQLVPVGLNFRDATAYVDELHVYVGHPIPYKLKADQTRHQQVIQMKSEVHTALTRLTTHIPETNYSEDLLKLKSKHVNFLDPISVNRCIESDFKDCESMPKSRLEPFRAILKTILKIVMFLPYAVWKLLVKPRIKEPEFIATFRFAVAVILAPIYLIILTLFLGLILSWSLALIILTSILIIALLTVKL